MAVFPTFQYEQELWREGYTAIGIDEVGRGAFAGPVYVTACSFTPTDDPLELKRLMSIGINDSKKLLPEKRNTLSSILHKESITFATAASSCDDINTHGIMKALDIALQNALIMMFEKMPQKKLFFLMDGAYLPSIDVLTKHNTRCIIKGDSLSLSIAAASILAKVERDTYMEELSIQYPQYHWQKNKGYGTRDHRDAIIQHGTHPQHRNMYLRKLLNSQDTTLSV